MPLENVILDLDETILSSERISEFIRYNDSSLLDKLEYTLVDDEYITFSRPLLTEFLNYLFDNYNVAVWTAATDDYAKFMVEHLILTKPDRKLDFIFHRNHCKKSNRLYGGDKNLNMIWDTIPGYNKYNSVLIDDLETTYHLQPRNVIQAIPFRFDNKQPENDKFLMYLAEYIDELK
jgi:TFIIF-interacting CTD phosphatase-like protein